MNPTPSAAPLPLPLDFRFALKGVSWRVRTPTESKFSWPPLFAEATTVGATTTFLPLYAPDAQSFAHEFYHVLHTSWLKYLVSFTIGRLWKSQYWKVEERSADAYGLANKTDPDFVAVAAVIRAALPSYVQTVTVTHPVPA